MASGRRRISELKEQFNGNNAFKSPEEFRIARLEEHRRQSQAIQLARSRAARYNMTLRALTIRQQKSLREFMNSDDGQDAGDEPQRDSRAPSIVEKVDDSVSSKKGNKKSTTKERRKKSMKKERKKNTSSRGDKKNPHTSSQSSSTASTAAADITSMEADLTSSEPESPHDVSESNEELTKSTKSKSKKKKKKKKKGMVSFNDEAQVVNAASPHQSRGSSMAGSELGAVNDVLADVLDFDLSSNEVLSRLSYSAEETLKRQSRKQAGESVTSHGYGYSREFVDGLVNHEDGDTITDDMSMDDNPFTGTWDDNSSHNNQSLIGTTTTRSDPGDENDDEPILDNVPTRKMSRKKSMVSHLKNISLSMRRRQSRRKLAAADDSVSMVPNDGDIDAEDVMTKVLEDFTEMEHGTEDDMENQEDDEPLAASPDQDDMSPPRVREDNVGVIMGHRGSLPLARGSVTGFNLHRAAPKEEYQIEMQGGEEVQVVVVGGGDSVDGSDEGTPAAVFYMNDLAEALKSDEDSKINQAVLRAFFQEHDPSRLGEVNELLEQYKGHEEELFSELNAQVEAKDNEILERLRSSSSDHHEQNEPATPKPQMRRVETTNTFLEVPRSDSQGEDFLNLPTDNHKRKETDLESMVEAPKPAAAGVRRLFSPQRTHSTDTTDRKDKSRKLKGESSKGIGNLVARNSYRARASAKLSLAFSQFKSRESRTFEEQEVGPPSVMDKTDSWWPIFFLLSPRAKEYISEKKGKWWKKLFHTRRKRGKRSGSGKGKYFEQPKRSQQASVNRYYFPNSRNKEAGGDWAVGWGKNKKPPVPREVGPTVVLRDLSKIRKPSMRVSRDIAPEDDALASFAEAVEQPAEESEIIRNPSTAAGAVAAAAVAAVEAVAKGEDETLNPQGYILSGIREGSYSRWTVNHMIKDRMAAAGVNDDTIQKAVVTSSEML